MDHAERLEETITASNASKVVVTGAGFLALLAGSCCVLPIALAIVGLGGSWLSILDPLVAYRSFILVGVAAVLIWAWYRIWHRGRAGLTRRGSVSIAGFATIAFIAALSAPLWEQDVARSMWQILIQRQ